MKINQIITTAIACILIISCSSTKKENKEKEWVVVPPQKTEIKEQSDNFLLNKWEKGIEFYAVGNEPSWAVDIDFEKGIKFQTMDGMEMNTPPSDPIKAQDANVTRIAAETAAGSIIITISEGDCNDTMSENPFRNKVRVEVKRSNEENYTTYEGCGNYVPDFRLHDIWVLEELNGKTLKQEDFPDKGLPRFEFFVKEGKISGHGGCNNMNGSFYIAEKNIIHIGNMATTMMACKNMEVENELGKALSYRRLKYEIKDLKLKLEGYDGTQMVFQKTD